MAERPKEGVPVEQIEISGSSPYNRIMQAEFGDRLIPYALLGDLYDSFYPGPIYLGQEIRIKGDWGGIADVVGFRPPDQDESRRIVQVLPQFRYEVAPFWVDPWDIVKDDAWPVIEGEPKTMGLEALEFSVEALYLPADQSRTRDHWKGIEHILAIKLKREKRERIISLGQAIRFTVENKLGEDSKYNGLITRLEMQPSESYTANFMFEQIYARAYITHMDDSSRYRVQSPMDLFSISINVI